MIEKERIEIRADRKFIETLENLSNQTGYSKAEVIRMAIALYQRAVEENQRDREIQFVPKRKKASDITESGALPMIGLPPPQTYGTAR